MQYLAVQHRKGFYRWWLAGLLALGAWLLVFLLLRGTPPLAAAGQYRFVAPNGVDGVNSCADSRTPCATVQHAVNQARPGDEIRVAAGVYTGVQSIAGLTQTVYVGKDLTLVGGFTTTNWALPDPVARPTILDAQGAGRVVYIPTGVTAGLVGFHLRGGAASEGAGLYSEGTLTVEQCAIYSNAATLAGGGVYVVAGTLTLKKSEIYSNSAGATGGSGVLVGAGVAVIEDNRIYNNQAAGATGGGIQVQGGQTTIRRNRIWGNQTSDGAGVFVYGNTTAVLENNLIYSNTASTGNGGGLLIASGATLHLLNNTLYGNRSAGRGGGLAQLGGTLWVTNTLVVSNTASAQGGISMTVPANVAVVSSDFFGNSPDAGYTGGTGNQYTRNPLFVNPATFDLHLTVASPVIDDGVAVAGLTEDFEGQGRPFGSGIDRGADEYTAPGTCYARLQGGAVYTDVQAAVDAASAGALVQVAGRCAGVTSREGHAQTVYISKSLTLQGGYTLTDWTTPRYGPAVLDAQSLGRVVVLTGTATITVENVQVTRGAAVNGAGLYVGPGVGGVLQNNIFLRNVATGDGGAVYNQGPVLTLLHNTFYSNTAVNGGAIFGGDNGGGQLLRSNGATLSMLAGLVEPPQLQLRSGAFDPLQSEPAVPAPWRRTLAATQAGLRLVQFPGPVTDAAYLALLRSGLEVVAYIPDNGYLVWGSEAAVTRLAAATSVRWSGPFQPYYALHPALADPAALPAEVEVVVQVYRHAGAEATVQQIQAAALQVINQPTAILNYYNLAVRVKADQLAWLAALSDVVNVEPLPQFEKLDEVQGQIMAGALNEAGTQPSGPGYLAWLQGLGLPTDPADYPIVDVTDDGIDNGTNTPLHADFYALGVMPGTDRLIYNANWTTDALADSIGGHGNLNAAIVAGYNNLSGSAYQDGDGYHYGLGINPFGRVAGSKIFCNSGLWCLTNNDFAAVISNTYALGARISSNSWGQKLAGGDYNAYAQAYDALVRDAQPGSGLYTGNQEIVVVFSAGNDGSSSSTIAPPATAKNVIAVGAAESYRPTWTDGCNKGPTDADSAMDMAAFSSRGPTDDNRVKPDLVAPGTHIIAAASQAAGYKGSSVCDPYRPDSQTLYAASSGTSHSAPAVAGAASLVYRYYQDHFGGAAPSPAMVKAYLVNATRYLNGTGAGGTLPSNDQGYGEVNLGLALDGTPRVVVDQERLLGETGAVYELQGVVADPGRPLRVTLAWTDAPGTPLAAAYVNNLDLEVVVGGQTYQGNVFSGGVSITGGSADTRNNVESVFLPAGVSGPLVVRVRATTIAGDGVPGNGDPTDQDFALVVYNSMQSVVMLNGNSVVGNHASGTGGGMDGAGLFLLSYNNFYNNTVGGGGNPNYGSVTPGATDFSVAPGFVDAANGDFHLTLTSAQINAGDPALPLAADFEADPRPQGTRPDVGADESLIFAEVALSDAPPQIFYTLGEVAGRPVTFTHTITNLGKTLSMTDAFTLEVVNNQGWTWQLLGISPTVVLTSGGHQTFRLVVMVPPTITALYNRTFLTATSRTSPVALDVTEDIMARPGVSLIPNYAESGDPGEVLTYTHTLINTGDAPDRYALSIASPLQWGTLLTPTTPITVTPGQTATVVVRVVVPKTAPAGLADVMTVTATSRIFPGVSAKVTDTTTANATIGTRYVATSGTDSMNNCTQMIQPCRSVGHAVRQTAWGDAVLVAQGVYTDADIDINQNINLLGGYALQGGDFIMPATGVDPNTTILDAGNVGRGMRIQVPAGVRPVVRGFTIRNAQTSGVGGGIYVQGSSAPTLTQLIIQKARAALGGGIYVEGGLAALQQITITEAAATTGGGGGLYINNGSPVVEQLVISQTSASQGGGIYVQNGSPVFNRVRIGLATANVGGGLYQAGGTLALRNTMIYSCTAAAGTGGGLHRESGLLTVINATFYGNRAATTGGALYDRVASTLVLSNSIIVSNTATMGGGVYRQAGTPPSADYNDVWHNSAGTFPDSNVALGSHSLAADPLFVDPAAGDLHLAYDSPCVDKADPQTPLTDDIDGDIRPTNQGYDIGADELVGCLARIKSTGVIYGNVQLAVETAVETDTIQLSGLCQGVTPRLVNGLWLSQTVFLSKSMTLEGGYNARFDNDPYVNPYTTTLDARSLGRVLVVSGTGEVSVTVVISNLILAHGDATGLDGIGGALYNNGGEVVIGHSTIQASRAVYGGGVANVSGTLTLVTAGVGERMRVISNTATQGGGVYVADGQLWLEASTLQENVAQLGGGLYAGGGAAFVHRSEVFSNTATSGGGLYAPATGVLTVVNTLVAYNTATDGGGLYNLAGSGLAVRHTTFYANRATGQGGGIYHDATVTTPVINSTLIASNTAASGSGIYSANADPRFNYNDLWNNGYGGNLVAGDGVGNLTVNPAFASQDPAALNFLRLTPGSPVEDRADPLSPILVDIDETPRPSNQGFDIGADELGTCYIRVNGLPPTYGNLQVAIRAVKGLTDVLRIAGTCPGVNPVVEGGQVLSQAGYLTKSLGLQGGYTVTDWTLSDPALYPTTLDALGLGRVLYITGTARVTMDGLHLRGGSAGNGGAILVGQGILTVTNSLFYGHTATQGGVLYAISGTTTLGNGTLLFGNQAARGAVVYNAGGLVTVDSTQVFSNTATDGGAVYHSSGASFVQNTIFQNNRATANGGVAYNAGSGLTFWHNVVYSNTATNGGGFYTVNATPWVVNTLFLSNTATAGRAIYSTVAFTPDYNDVFPATNGYGGSAAAGAHSLTVEPQLVSVATGNFHLLDTSPLLDRGDPAVTLYRDFEGDYRPGDQGFDIGADERPSCVAQIVRTGVIYGNLQRAINFSQPGDEILVTSDYPCRGVHPWNNGGQIISQTVHVTHSVWLHGGYTLQNQWGGFVRSYPLVPTTLDPQGLGRAVLVTGTTVITADGFILRNGTAAGLGGGPGGADAGGALYYHGLGGLLEAWQFFSNTATYGGALFSNGQGLTLTLSQLSNNIAGQQGGAVFVAANDLTLLQSSLSGNRAQRGGGVANGGGQPRLLGSQIFSNTAVLEGGGFYNGTGTPLLDLGNRFYGNQAPKGGALYHAGGTAAYWNNLLYHNLATEQGGGLYMAGGTAAFLHNTLYWNQAYNQGGGVYVAGGTVAITNTIFDTNEADQGSAVYGSVGTLGYNDYWPNPAEVQVAGGIPTGTHNLNLEPLYVGPVDDVGTPGTEDFHLQDRSPLIDVGQTLTAVTRDMDDDPRPINQTSDIGADEFNACLARLARTQQVYGRIGDAVDAAEAGDTIQVAVGRCEESVTIDKRLTISGSWLKDFSRQTTPDTGEDYVATTIDALGLDRVVSIAVSHGGGIGPDVTLSRMAYTRGRGGDGGGVYVADNTWARLEYGEIYNSVATGNGGGIYNGSGSHVTLWGVGAYSNTATGRGGGVYNASGSTVHLTGADITKNKAYQGGGIYDAGGEFSIVNEGVSLNQASENGGGIYLASGGSAKFINLTLATNLAQNGAGLYNARSDAQLYHATLRNNSATGSGGGVYNLGSGTVISACIVASNSAGTAGSGIYGSPAVAVAYTLRWINDYAGVVEGEGNLVGNPAFTLYGSLSLDSPAIDAVPNAASSIGYDTANNPRPQLCAKDMGVEEYGVGRRLLEWVNTPQPPEWLVEPPVTVPFTFTLKNSSERWFNVLDSDTSLGPGTGYTESVTLTLRSQQGWAVIDRIINGGNISIALDRRSARVDIGPSAYMPGQVVYIVVSATVPMGTFASVTDTISLSATAASCIGAPLGIESPPAVVRIKEVRDFVIAPDHVGAALPGQTITYTHVLTNLGNITDTYTLYPRAGFYAVGEIAQPQPPQVNLGPGQSASFVMSVTIKPEAAGGLVDVTNAMAQSEVGTIRGVADSTSISYTVGTRYVATDGQDSLVDERVGNPDPLAVDYRDNNCTRPDIAACRTLQQALAQAAAGDLIKIARGTYTETYDVSYQGITVTQLAFVNKPVVLQGGYDKANWNETPPNHISQTTVLSPTQGRAIFVTAGVSVTLDRLALTGGSASGLHGGPTGEDAGGNLYHAGGPLWLNAVRLSDGQATVGGGLYAGGGPVWIQNSLFYSNTVSGPTGGLGGGGYVSGTVTLLNNTFYNNRASNMGGAFYAIHGALVVTNTIVANNNNGESGAALVAENGGAADYNLYWQNVTTHTNSLLPPGANSLVDVDPLLVAPAADPPDLRLQRSSPARERGDPATPLEVMPLDYANQSRLQGNRVDIGAYEYPILPGVALEPDYTQLVDKGVVITYTHTLTNIGDFQDVFTLTLSSSQGWATLLTPAVVSLNEGATATVQVRVVVPAVGSGGLVDTTVITATSSRGVGVFDTATDITQVRLQPGLALAPDRTGLAYPGTWITYTHTLTNTGDGPDTYTLTVQSMPGWTVMLTPPSPVSVGYGQTQTLSVAVYVPAGTFSDTVHTVRLTASSWGGPTLTAAVTDTTTVRRVWGVALTPDYSQTVTTQPQVVYTHRLTNTGNFTDTFALVQTSSAGWSGLTPSGPVLLGPGQVALLTVTVTIPAGSGGLSDVTQITATSQTSPTVTAAVTDTTNVQLWEALWFYPDQARDTNANTVVTYTHTLSNAGNVARTVTLTYTGSRGWPTVVVPSGPLALAAGQAMPVVVTITVPSGTALQVDRTVVTAMLTENPAVQAAVVDTTTVQQIVQVALEPDRTGAGYPGTWITYTHTLTNEGDGPDTFNLSYQSSQGWTVNLQPASVALGAGATAPVTAAIWIPAGSGGLVDVTTLRATSTVRPTVSDVATDTTTVTRTVGVQLVPDRAALADPGAAAVYTHTLTNTGNGTDTFTLTVTLDQGAPWAVAVVPAQVTLPAGGTAIVTVTVTVPAGALSGTVAIATATATSWAAPGQAASAQDTTTVRQVAGLLLEPDRSQNTAPGTVVTYTHQLTNTGNSADTFNLSFTSSQGWAALTPAGPVALGPGASTWITVVVTVPPTAVDNTVDTTVVTARSQADPTKADTATDVTTVGQHPGVIFVPDQVGRTDPGTWITYTHWLTNSGDGLDTFTITHRSGWTLTPPAPFTVTLGAQQGTALVVTVTVPLGTGGLTDTAWLTATSAFSPAVYAVVTDATGAIHQPGVALSAGRAVTTTPGSVVAFTHIVTNTGNGPDVITFQAASSQGWPVAPVPPLAVGFGAAQPVTISLTVPAGAVSGTVATLAITATSQAQSSLSATATNTVTVVGPPPRFVYLPLVLRNFSPDGPDLTIAGLTFSATPLAGQPVTVSVTVANVGNRAVTVGNNFYVDFYVDRVPQLTLNGDLSWGAQGAWFGVGQSRTLTGVYTFTTGLHNVYVQADTDNTVRESNEGNNIYGPQPVNVTGLTGLQGSGPTPPPLYGPRPTPTPLP